MLPVFSVPKSLDLCAQGAAPSTPLQQKAMFLDAPRRIRNFLKGPSWAPAPTKRFFHSLMQGDTQSAPPLHFQ